MKTNLVFLFLFINIYVVSPQSIEEEKYVVDIDGNRYRTVRIGSQVWMTENLRVTHYRNGDSILSTITDTLDYRSEKEPKYQFVYKNDLNNLQKYGRLYTWFVVVDKRNICPVGWHIPTIEEFKQLDIALGGKDLAIGKLKSTDAESWLSPNSDATNESGFNGLPGGWRAAKGSFGALGKYGHWWCSDMQSPEFAFRMFLSYNEACYKNHLGSSDPQNAWSVRCVKDSVTKY